jgi:uncharacterized protein
VSESCIYTGTIRHRRFEPDRRFTHPLALTYVDLDELPTLLGGRLVARRPGAVRFRRSDYHGDSSRLLRTPVLDTVQEQTGIRPAGPVRVLTQPRSFGLCFNPVSFYYCFDGAGERVESVLAEVTNTPWGERHAYVLRADCPGSRLLNGQFQKALHVSPFMGMDHSYSARYAPPGETLSVHIESRREGRLIFDATLAMARRELSRASIARMTVRYPLAAARVLALIYGHAVALKLRHVPVHPHPGRQRG